MNTRRDKRQKINQRTKFDKEYVAQPQRELKDPEYQKIKEMMLGQHGFNVIGRVMSVQIKEQEKKDGSKIIVASGQLGDQTGVINFNIMGTFAECMEMDSIVCVRNGRSEISQKKHRLEIDRWGKVTKEDDVEIDKEDVKVDNNLSAITYEMKLVPQD